MRPRPPRRAETYDGLASPDAVAGRSVGLANRRKVPFAFSLVLAAALNFAFFTGELSDPAVHDVRLLFAALTANAAATVLKVGDRSHIGAVQLSASLVAVLQLTAAVATWALAGAGDGTGPQVTAQVVSLSGGALMVGVVSVTLLLVDALTSRLTLR